MSKHDVIDGIAKAYLLLKARELNLLVCVVGAFSAQKLVAGSFQEDTPKDERSGAV